MKDHLEALVKGLEDKNSNPNIKTNIFKISNQVPLASFMRKSVRPAKSLRPSLQGRPQVVKKVGRVES